MAEIELPVVITAITNSESESFVAGTLYSQGWSVIYRAINVESLILYIQANAEVAKNSLLIYSPDLSGITPEKLQEYGRKLRQVIGFTQHHNDASDFPGILSMPQDATELISIVRGVLRAPMIRESRLPTSAHRRAQVIALAGVSTSSGCSTVAINVAMEASLLGRDVLLLDGDVRRPSIAPLLALRNMQEGEPWQIIATHLSAGEITQERTQSLSTQMERAMQEFDLIIIDLGSIEKVADSLTDRRWTAAITHWSCDTADELILIGRADAIGIHRLKDLVTAFSALAMRAKVSVLLNMKSASRKEGELESAFLAAIAVLRPERIFTLPRDLRAVTKAQADHATLVEIDDRSVLRKAIAKFAVELKG